MELDEISEMISLITGIRIPHYKPKVFFVPRQSLLNAIAEYHGIKSFNSKGFCSKQNREVFVLFDASEKVVAHEITHQMLEIYFDGKMPLASQHIICWEVEKHFSAKRYNK